MLCYIQMPRVLPAPDLGAEGGDNIDMGVYIYLSISLSLSLSLYIYIYTERERERERENRSTTKETPPKDKRRVLEKFSLREVVEVVSSFNA